MDRLKSFQQVIALEETGNYRKAAERLGVTHSALSQAIAKLENEYGAALFVRNKRATVPTAFGRRLIEGARIALTAMEDAEREIGLMRNLEAGRLVIGADPSVSESLVGPALARLMRAYPKLHFTVLSRNWKTMEEDLEAKKIDLYIGLAPDQISDRFEYRPMALAAPVAACRAGHPIAEGESTSLLRGFDYPIIGGDSPDWLLSYTFNAFPGKFDSLDTLRDIFLITHDLGLMRHLLATTDAVALTPLPIIYDSVQTGQIVLLNIEDLPFGRTVPGVIASLAGRPLPPAAAKLTECIEDLIAGR
jgi:LysR family transcriptional regulator, nitrogen assimilation regulatory protein